MKAYPKILSAGILLACLCVSYLPANAADFTSLDKCNIIWNSPGKNMHDSMPLGNGDIGLNFWTEENGDLLFYISKTDSWGDNGRLLKIGKVRISLSPNPIVSGTEFTQTLDLKKGQITIDIKGDNPANLKLWVDANNPAAHLTIDSRKNIKATAKVELWRTEQKTRPPQVASPLSQDPQGRQVVVEPDTVIENYADGIAWFHRNIKSVGPEMTMKFQGLDDYPEFKDTLLHRTFGAVVKGKDSEKIDDTTLECTQKTHRFSVYVLTEHPSTQQQWTNAIERMIADIENTSFKKRYDDHCKWWNKFWNRSWFYASTDNYIPASMIPSNDYTFRVGFDQHGSNKFSGRIDRLSIIKQALSTKEIKVLAESRSELIDVNKSNILYSSKPQLHTELKDSAGWTDSGELTIEAWLNPEKLPDSGARIIDKITPGGSDGMLMDTWPGNSLRLIVANNILSLPNCLPPDKWSHVVVTINSQKNRIELFLNGELSADQGSAEYLDDASVVTRAYNLQRFIDACGSRGHYPVKFNGSIFTVDYQDDPDDRRWGQGYWWQNSRLPYISMAASGDFDLMQPLFRMYVEDIFPLCLHRTKKYFGFDGAYFAECMYPWGAVFSQTYGWDKPFSERKDPLQTSMWHKWEWVAGPELVFMMMDYYDYTQDEKFLTEKVLPVANAVISFFDNYYETDKNGKLLMHPSQAVETWIECTNPQPETSGLHAITKRLLLLDEHLSTGPQREKWKTFLRKLPDIPTHDTEDGKALAPAEKFAKKINVENPELYAVFPFRHIAVGNPNIDWGINALKYRQDRGSSGWRQDDIFMAYLGLTEQARSFIVSRARSYDKNSRFPAFWGPNYDWVPDQDHGGVLMKAAQAMLIQPDPYSKKIYLLPAWPKQWNADFKLHAPYKTVIQATVRNGQVENLKVTPKERLADIQICD